MSRIIQIITSMRRIISKKGNNRKRILFYEFNSLGGVYVKFLQILAVNQNFMKGWSGPSESSVFENVKFEKIDINSEISHCKHIIHSIDSEPFASGSFAQVYKAKLTNGDDVVLKILRPSVRKNLKTDLLLLGLTVYIIQFISPSSIIDMRQAFKEIRQTTEAEIDYKREVQTALWFFEYFRNNKSIVVPYTYAQFSNKHVIIQQYVGGVSLSEVIGQQTMGNDASTYVDQQLGSDIWEQMSLLGCEYLKTALVGEYVLADPHPGNVKLLSNNRVGLIDFGMVIHAPINREPFLKLVGEYIKLFNGKSSIESLTRAMMEYFDYRLVSCLDRVTQQQSDISLLDEIGIYVKELVKDHNLAGRYESAMRERRIATMFNSIINEGNRFGIYANSELILLQRSTLMYMSMTGLVCRPSGIDTYNYVVSESLRRAQEYVDINGIPSSTQPALSDTEAYEVALNWLDYVADRNLGLINQINSRIYT